MKTVPILAVEDVFEAAQQSPTRNFSVDGVAFRRTDTVDVFIRHGIVCASCKRSALFFTYFNHTDPATPHKELRLMFDHTTKNGQFAYMTKDHIIPKSKGGPDAMENYQPMCNVCNSLKSDEFDVNDIPERALKYISPDRKAIISRKTTIDPYYLAYIRWYTSIFHKNAKDTAWSTSIRERIRHAMKQATPDFNQTSFNMAYGSLRKEVKASHLRPAKLFDQQRKNLLTK